MPPGSIIADFASWDTVGNAWFARMAVEALLDIAFRHGDTPDDPHASPPPPPTPPTVLPSLSTPRSLPFPGSSVKGAAVGDPAEEGEAKAASSGGVYDDAKKDDYDRGVFVVGGVGIGEEEVEEEVKKAGVAEREDRGGEAEEEKEKEDGEEKLPAARAGEAYGGGEMRKWMFAWKAKKAKARRGPLNVTVFVSDFHAERMDVVFQWVFGLKPSLLEGKATVTVRGPCGAGRCDVVWCGVAPALLRQSGGVFCFTWRVGDDAWYQVCVLYDDAGVVVSIVVRKIQSIFVLVLFLCCWIFACIVLYWFGLFCFVLF